jgi:hypothetical protein
LSRNGLTDLRRELNDCTAWSFGVASAAVLALFLWQGNVGLGLSDEGFLWYGVRRVLHGEVPVRDFMAYDPGRYYWSAVFMKAWGRDGIVALRAATAILQTLALATGAALVARSAPRPSIAYLLLAAVTLLAWMLPRHKLFDISISIILVGALAFLVRHPSTRRLFGAGACVGLAAVFGRNHGVYGASAGLATIAWLAIDHRPGFGFVRAAAVWSVGAFVGFLPVMVLAIAIPGFASAFWESIRFLFEIEATNLPLAVPWPWRAPFGNASFGEAAGSFVTGLFFVGVIAFGVVTLAYVGWRAWRKEGAPPVLVAAAFLTLPYAHFALSRADVSHLAQGIFPALIGSLALLASQGAKVKWPLVALLCVASLWITVPKQPGLLRYAARACVEVGISGDALRVDPGTADAITMLTRFVAQYAPEGRAFFVTPSLPGAYAILDRKSPTWEIYALFPRGVAFEEAEIGRIEAANVGFALIVDHAQDGRDELRFRNTHPLIYKYIREKFDAIGDHSLPDGYELFRSRRPFP